MSGRYARGGLERRRDPYADPRKPVSYTMEEFISYYGPQDGREAWELAGKRGQPRYHVGMKVRALTKLEGDKGQVVNKGDIGEVTALPGHGSDVDPQAVAEVVISQVRFDAHADMIEPAAPRRDAPPPRREYRDTYASDYRSAPRAPPSEGERRNDPNDPSSRVSYTRQEFIEHYGKDKGLSIWRKAGSASAGGRQAPERRHDPNEPRSRKTYTRDEFIEHYGPRDGNALWKRAGDAGQAEKVKRPDPNEPNSRKTYTREEFIEHYGAKEGSALWKKAEERRPDPNESSRKTYTRQEFLDVYGAKRGVKEWERAAKAAPSGKKLEDRKTKHVIKKEGAEKIGWGREVLKIVNVDEDSPAEKAGVKKSHRIASINGKTVTEHNITELVKEAGDTLEVELIELRCDPSDPRKREFSYKEFCDYYRENGPNMWRKAGKTADRRNKDKKNKDKDDDKDKEDAEDEEEEQEKEEEEEKEQEKPAEEGEKEEKEDEKDA